MMFVLLSGGYIYGMEFPVNNGSQNEIVMTVSPQHTISSINQIVSVLKNRIDLLVRNCNLTVEQYLNEVQLIENECKKVKIDLNSNDESVKVLSHFVKSTCRSIIKMHETFLSKYLAALNSLFEESIAAGNNFFLQSSVQVSVQAALEHYRRWAALGCSFDNDLLCETPKELCSSIIGMLIEIVGVQAEYVVASGLDVDNYIIKLECLEQNRQKLDSITKGANIMQNLDDVFTRTHAKFFEGYCTLLTPLSVESKTCTFQSFFKNDFQTQFSKLVDMYAKLVSFNSPYVTTEVSNTMVGLLTSTLENQANFLISNNFSLEQYLTGMEILEKDCKKVKLSIQSGVQNSSLGINFALQTGHSFQIIYKKFLDAYTSQLTTLLEKTQAMELCVLGNTPNEAPLQIQFQTAVLLYNRLMQLQSSHIQQKDIQQIVDTLTKISSNLK